MGEFERRWNPIPLIVRATFNATGAITFTGNTLGLSRSEVSGAPGTLDSIGAFTTTNTTIRYGSYPLGTTDSYLLNSSSAQFVLPAGSSILYAELIWGGSYINGTVNLSAAINNPVIFTTPVGSFSVSPDAATSNDVDLGGGTRAYVRSANVTALVQQGGAGSYTTGQVPGTIIITNDPTGNHAGWTLGVIYQNPTLPFRNMSLRAGAILIQSTSSPVTTTLTGFATPVSGALGGRALFSAQEGDANRNGDQALFGPTTSNLIALSGSNNFANNFFASQINNDLGQLNTTGTFGTRNQTNGAPGTNISGGRQGWDITNVDISSRLVNNQTTALLRLTTSGDAYVLNANGIQVDINAPFITVSKAANVAGVLVGDTIRYTVTVSNTGTANATDAIVSDVLPSGTAFVSGSVTVGGIPRPTGDITTGISIGTIAPGASIAVAYSARAVTIPTLQQLVNVANVSFSFQSVAGGPVTPAVIPSNAVTLPVYSPLLALVKTVNAANALVGSTLTYLITIQNNGNIAGTTTVTDPIPAGTSFVPGSVTLNGAPVPGGNIAAGVPIGSLAPGATATVGFQVAVQSVPSPPRVSNQASAVVSFTVPDGRTSSQSAQSNTVTIPAALPSIAATKSANFADVAVGETLTYTVTVNNTSTGPVTDVLVQDQLPPGASFVSGSVLVNGSSVPPANPASGIPLGTLIAGAAATISFSALITSVPTLGTLNNLANIAFRSGTFNSVTVSNTVVTPVYQPIMSSVKSVNRTIAEVGDTLTYTVLVTNTGNLSATAVLSDSLPEGTAFVPGSVTVDTISVPGASPVTGISLGPISPGNTVRVTFQFNMISQPASSRIRNQANVAYSFQLPSGRALTGYSSNSNVVDLPATSPSVSVAKSVSSGAAVLNDILTYNLVIQNNSVSPITQVVLVDTLPAVLSFVPGSVIIGGTAAPLAFPGAGIPLPSIDPGGQIAVSFQARVISVPSTIPAIALNRANVSYTAGTFNGTASSPPVQTSLYRPDIQIIKTSNDTAITVGGTFIYTLQVTNAGNFPADVVVTDLIPSSMIFVPNSVVINGFPVPGEDPGQGINLDTISAGETNTISFSVNVVSLPVPQQTVNSATASIVYTIPGGRVLTDSASSNPVTVTVSSPDVDVVKSADAVGVVTGDRITYSLVVSNNGIDDVTQVVVIDRPQEGLQFVPGSVIVGGASVPSASPIVGIPIGTLAASASVTVTFEVIISMAVTPPISNQSTVSFTSGTFASSSVSNAVVTPVTQPDISLVKSADTDNATLGDTIVYSVAVSNTGNLPANLTLTDALPAGTVFIPNSVVVGTIPVPGVSPVTGINVGAVAVGSVITVTFAVIVDSLPTPQVLTNTAAAEYTFTTPDGRFITEDATSNTLSIPVSAPNVTLVKSSNRANTAIGDVITFTIIAANAGIDAVTNAILADATPDGTVFVPGSVMVNGASVSTAVPSTGINLGTIAEGTSVTVTFNVEVTSLPASQVVSNQASISFTSGAFAGISYSNVLPIPVNQPLVTAVKSSLVADATVGDTIQYTITVTNSGNYSAAYILTDTIPAGTSFVTNSVVINGSARPGVSPLAGIDLGVLEPGSALAVSFSVLIEALPVPPQLVNQATVTYNFTLPDGRTFAASGVSNSVTVGVRAPNVSVVKSTTTTATTVGDTIEYLILVTNAGITAITNTILTDPVPEGTTFVPGSVTVSGNPVAGVQPASGINLGTIGAGATVPVAFQVAVNAIPGTELVSNRAYVSFTSGSLSATSFSDIIQTPAFLPIVAVVKGASSMNATVGDTIVYTVDIQNTGNISANASLTDIIPAGAVLVPNSVIYNSTSIPGADPSTGITLGVLPPGGRGTLLFSVVITSLPTSQTLSNQAQISFTYTLPDTRTFNGSSLSNTVVTPVSSPNVTLLKSSTFPVAAVGDTVPFTTAITNSGIQVVTNVNFVDSLPAGVTFVAGSVTVDGEPRGSANPAIGIVVGTIPAGGTVVVSFNALIASLPASGRIMNQASAGFDSGAFSGISYSNPVVMPVYQAIPLVVKSANVSVATIGDTVVYSLNVTNSGNIAASVTLSDSIPDGAEFVPNSVIINGVSQPGADPEAGFPIGTVPPGGTVVVSVSLQVTVEALPLLQQLVNQASAAFTYVLPNGRSVTGSVNSNTVRIPVSAPEVTVVKSTPAQDAVSGDVITYTIVITNRGITTVNNVVFVDPIPSGSSFVEGSVTLNTAPVAGANPASGIIIGSIPSGGTATVTFQVQVL